jgi:hypothetical protein
VPASPYPERDGLSDIYCIGQNNLYGFSRKPGPVFAGDIVLTKEPGGAGFCKWSHSGIVTAVDTLGNPTMIRQKDGPTTCVVDLTYAEFKKSWVDAAGTSAIFMAPPGQRGVIP